MSDMKSKMPDFKELASMTGKLFGDIKTSVTQIIQEYKDNRAESGEQKENVAAAVKPEQAKNADEPEEKQ